MDRSTQEKFLMFWCTLLGFNACNLFFGIILGSVWTVIPAMFLLALCLFQVFNFYDKLN